MEFQIVLWDSEVINSGFKGEQMSQVQVVANMITEAA